MKIFYTDSGSYKVNFVDINNRLVGYDMEQHCCENADWLIAKRDDVPSYAENSSHYGILNENIDDLNKKLEPYVFDKDFFKTPSWNLGEGDVVCFKLYAKGMPDLFLYLYNYHNGYYGHGFTFQEGNEILCTNVL